MARPRLDPTKPAMTDAEKQRRYRERKKQRAAQQAQAASAAPTEGASMNELIKVTDSQIGGNAVKTVNARDLHAGLGVGKDFSSWIKVQIERARLVDGRDYVVTQKGENPAGGRPSLEYHLTLDAAKHIAMMSGTDKGFEVRDYFIECERRALSAAPQPMIPQTLHEALRLAADLAEGKARAEAALAEEVPKRLVLEAKVEVLEPKVASLSASVALLEPKAMALHRFAGEVEGELGIRETSGAVQFPERKLVQGMIDIGLWYREKRPYSERTQVLAYAGGRTKGWFKHVPIVIGNDSEGREIRGVQLKILPAGLAKIALLIERGRLSVELVNARAVRRLYDEDGTVLHAEPVH